MSAAYAEQLDLVREMGQLGYCNDVLNPDEREAIAAVVARLDALEALEATLAAECQGVRRLDWLSALLSHVDANFKAVVGEEGDWTALTTAYLTAATMTNKLRALLAPSPAEREASSA